MTISTTVTELPDPGDGLGPNPKIVMTFEGTHDVSRIVHLLSRGLVEHATVAVGLVRELRANPGGLAALKLLVLHGGPDFTHEYPGGVAADDKAGEDEPFPSIGDRAMGSAAVSGDPVIGTIIDFFDWDTEMQRNKSAQLVLDNGDHAVVDSESLRPVAGEETR